MGKSLDSPEKRNVGKMLEKCRQMSEKCRKNCPERLKTQFSDVFWTIFAYLVVLLFGDPLQCSPVTSIEICRRGLSKEPPLKRSGWLRLLEMAGGRAPPDPTPRVPGPLPVASLGPPPVPEHRKKSQGWGRSEGEGVKGRSGA